jgi:hypothetical protein
LAHSSFPSAYHYALSQLQYSDSCRATSASSLPTAVCVDIDPHTPGIHNRSIRLFGETGRPHLAIRVNHTEIRCSPVKYPTLSTTCCGAVWICTRAHRASAFCVHELQVENYGKHLANSNRSTPLSERRARNLSSLVFVVWQQYGRQLFMVQNTLL